MAVTKNQNRITGAEIANVLGISQATVSRALAGNRRISQKVRDQVQEAARNMGYVSNAAARTLVKGRSNVVGILTGGLHVERTASEIIALDAELRERGFHPYISYTRSEADRIVEGARHLIEQGVDGLMIIGVAPGAVEELKYQALTKILPTVFVDSPLVGHDVNLIAHNYLAAYDEAGRILREQGRRNVFGWWEHSFKRQALSYDSRFNGFHALLSQFGNPEQRIYLMPPTLPPALHDTREACRQTQERLQQFFKRHPQCDALICHSDQLAITAMTYLLSRSKPIPEQIALLGFDNQLLGERVTPALSTIAQQPNLLAQKAVERLLELIDHPEDEAKTIAIPGLLIRRETL